MQQQQNKIDYSLTSDEYNQWSKLTVPELYTLKNSMEKASENKREELRQVVGKRYRILIDSTNVVNKMNNIIEKVVDDIQLYNDKVLHFEFDALKDNTDDYNNKEINNDSEIDTSYNNIWQELTIKNFIKASKIYWNFLNIYESKHEQCLLEYSL